MEKKKNPPFAKDCAHSFLLGYKKELNTLCIFSKSGPGINEKCLVLMILV